MSVNNVPLGMGEAPPDLNTLTIYALDKNGSWLQAMTVRVDVNDIIGDNWEQPLQLAVRGDKYQLPE